MFEPDYRGQRAAYSEHLQRHDKHGNVLSLEVVPTMLDKCHFVMKTSKYWLQRHTLYLASGLGFGHCGTMAGPGPARRYFIWEGSAGADAGATVVLPAPGTGQMPNNHVFEWPLAQAEVFFYW